MSSNSASNPTGSDLSPASENDLNSVEAKWLRSEGTTALAALFDRYRSRLEKIVEFRMDERIKRRVDSADVLQEAYIELSKRLPEFVAQPSVSVFVWMRQKTLQTLIDLHREHFRDKRDPNKEVRQSPNWNSNETGLSIHAYLSASMTSPSQHLIRGEEVLKLQAAIDQLSELDREVIALRHFEQLTNLQVAEVLNLTPTAASNRYIRAISRLSETLTSTTESTGKK